MIEWVNVCEWVSELVSVGDELKIGMSLLLIQKLTSNLITTFFPYLLF